MFIEYKIRFEHGGVTVTQIVEPDGSMQVPAQNPDGPPKSQIVRENRLPRVSESKSGGGGTDPGHVGGGGTDPGHVGGGGTDPGHVGSRLGASGTVIVFGPIIINCVAAPNPSDDEEK